MASRNVRLYRQAYNEHVQEFFYGTATVEDHVELSNVDIEKEEAILNEEFNEYELPETRIPSNWTEKEKNQFFEFLGRYGIHQIEKIQSKIKTKSILQIQLYYNLLKQALTFYKYRKRFFKKLIRYEDFPAALEVDETACAIEEDFSTKLNPITAPPVVAELNNPDENDTEEELINYDRLLTLSNFYYNLSHLNTSPLRPKMFTPDVKAYFNQLVKEITTLFIENVIADKILYSKKPVLDENGKILDYEVNDDMVRSVFLSLNLKRPFLKIPFLNTIRERLDFEIIDYDTEVVFQKRNFFLDEYGREVLRLVRGFKYVGEKFHSEELFDDIIEKEVEDDLRKKERFEFHSVENEKNAEYKEDDIAYERYRNQFKRAIVQVEQRRSEGFNPRTPVMYLENPKDESYVESVKKKRELESKRKRREEKKEQDELAERLLIEEDRRCAGKFITDNKNEESLLDNDLAWLLLSKETQDCDLRDFTYQKFNQRSYLYQFGMLEDYDRIRHNTSKNALAEYPFYKEKVSYSNLFSNRTLNEDIKYTTQQNIDLLLNECSELEEKLKENPENPQDLEEQINRIKREIVNEKKSMELFMVKALYYYHGDQKVEEKEQRTVLKLRRRHARQEKKRKLELLKLEKKRKREEQQGNEVEEERNEFVEDENEEHSSSESELDQDVISNDIKKRSIEDSLFNKEDSDYYSDVFLEEIGEVPDKSDDDEENKLRKAKRRKKYEVALDDDYEKCLQEYDQTLSDPEADDVNQRAEFIQQYQNSTKYPSYNDVEKEEKLFEITPDMQKLFSLMHE